MPGFLSLAFKWHQQVENKSKKRNNAYDNSTLIHLQSSNSNLMTEIEKSRSMCLGRVPIGRKRGIEIALPTWRSHCRLGISAKGISQPKTLPLTRILPLLTATIRHKGHRENQFLPFGPSRNILYSLQAGENSEISSETTSKGLNCPSTAVV